MNFLGVSRRARPSCGPAIAFVLIVLLALAGGTSGQSAAPLTTTVAQTEASPAEPKVASDSAPPTSVIDQENSISCKVMCRVRKRLQHLRKTTWLCVLGALRLRGTAELAD